MAPLGSGLVEGPTPLRPALIFSRLPSFLTDRARAHGMCLPAMPHYTPTPILRSDCPELFSGLHGREHSSGGHSRLSCGLRLLFMKAIHKAEVCRLLVERRTVCLSIYHLLSIYLPPRSVNILNLGAREMDQ